MVSSSHTFYFRRKWRVFFFWYEKNKFPQENNKIQMDSQLAAFDFQRHYDPASAEFSRFQKQNRFYNS